MSGSTSYPFTADQLSAAWNWFKTGNYDPGWLANAPLDSSATAGSLLSSGSPDQGGLALNLTQNPAAAQLTPEMAASPSFNKLLGQAAQTLGGTLSRGAQGGLGGQGGNDAQYLKIGGQGPGISSPGGPAVSSLLANLIQMHRNNILSQGGGSSARASLLG